MKKTVLLFLMMMPLLINAQEKKAETGWKKGGHFGFIFSQTAFKNWTKGGEDALTGNLKIDYNINYKDAKQSWDTKFLFGYGMTQINNVLKKTDDNMEINSIYGYDLAKYWKFSFFGNLKTQLTTGYDYTTTPNTKTSNFFAPAFISAGPGLLYKRSDNFYINFAPVTSKLVIVNDPDLSAAGAFGVDPGKTLRYELGMNYQMFFKFSPVKNVTVENLFNAFSNYLDKPQNIDIDNLFTVRMKINKYLGAHFSLQTVYDDNTIQKLQYAELFGLQFGLDL